MLLVGCDGGGTTTTSTAGTAPTTTRATTTTIDLEAACVAVAEDAIGLLGEFVTTLDGVSASQLNDPALWPSGLTELQTRGRVLDDRAVGLGCDLGAIQQIVLAEVVSLEADGPVARLLLEALAGAGP